MRLVFLMKTMVGNTGRDTAATDATLREMETARQVAEAANGAKVRGSYGEDYVLCVRALHINDDVASVALGLSIEMCTLILRDTHLFTTSPCLVSTTA